MVVGGRIEIALVPYYAIKGESEYCDNEHDASDDDTSNRAIAEIIFVRAVFAVSVTDFDIIGVRLGCIDTHRHRQVCVVERNIVGNKERHAQDNLVTSNTFGKCDHAVIATSESEICTRNLIDVFAKLYLKVLDAHITTVIVLESYKAGVRVCKHITSLLRIVRSDLICNQGVQITWENNRSITWAEFHLSHIRIRV